MCVLGVACHPAAGVCVAEVCYDLYMLLWAESVMVRVLCRTVDVLSSALFPSLCIYKWVCRLRCLAMFVGFCPCLCVA